MKKLSITNNSEMLLNDVDEKILKFLELNKSIADDFKIEKLNLFSHVLKIDKAREKVFLEYEIYFSYEKEILESFDNDKEKYVILFKDKFYKFLQELNLQDKYEIKDYYYNGMHFSGYGKRPVVKGDIFKFEITFIYSQKHKILER